MPTRYVPPRFVPTPGVANGMEYKDGPVGIGTSAVAGQPLTVQAGAGTGAKVVMGVIHVNTTAVGNAANTNEQDLWTYSLPANTLNADGRGVRITLLGQGAANTNSKTWKLFFGATQIFANTSSTTGVRFRAVVDVIRTGAASQIWGSHNGTLNGMWSESGTAAADTTGAIVIKATGTAAAGTANDITFRYAMVEAF